MESQERRPHSRGEIHVFKAALKRVEVLFLSHAIDRMSVWGLSLGMVAETLLTPEEVLRGHRDRFIAQRRYGEHVLRVVYEYTEGRPAVVTVYFPYAKRYFQGGGCFEDQVLR